jgi:hypothetical protein
VRASSTVPVAKAMESRLSHAGTTPLNVLTVPFVGLNPTIPLNSAGTLPDPAVSVPMLKLTRLEDTETQEPDEDPPGIWWAEKGMSGIPCRLRHPVKPVASWSRFVFPIGIAPRDTRVATIVEEAVGM